MDYGFLSEILEKVCQRLEKLYVLENEIRKIINFEKGLTIKDFFCKKTHSFKISKRALIQTYLYL